MVTLYRLSGIVSDSFAKMPPLETFMGIDPHTARKHLYYVRHLFLQLDKKSHNKLKKVNATSTNYNGIPLFCSDNCL